MRGNASRLIVFVSLLCLGLAVFGYLRRGAEIGALENKVAQLNASSAERVRRLQVALADEKKSDEPPPADKDRKKTMTVTGSETYSSSYRFDLMRKDPSYAWIWRKQQLRNVQRQYGDVIAAMKLPPDEVTKLRNLLVERETAQSDARETALQAGLSPGEVGVAVSQAKSDINDEIESLVGDDAYKLLLQQPPGMFKIMISNSAGLDLEMAGIPLTPAQTSSLAQAYSDVYKSGITEFFSGNNDTPDPETGLTPKAQALLDRVTPSLTPEQLPVMKDYLIEQIQQQQYYQKMTAQNRVP